MQQFHRFITLRLCVAQHASGASTRHREHTTALAASGFYRWSVAVAALLVVVCQTTTNNAPTTALQR